MYSSREVKRCAIRLLKKVAAIKAAQPPQQNNTERLPSPLKVLPPRYPTYEESKIKIEPIPLAKPGQGKLEHAVIRPGMVFQPVYQVQMFPPKSEGIAGQAPSQTPGVNTAPSTPAQTVPQQMTGVPTSVPTQVPIPQPVQSPQNTTSYTADLDRIGAVIDRELGRLRRFRQDWEKGHRFLHSGEGVTVNFEPSAEESFNSPYSDSFYYEPEGKRNAQSSGMTGMWSFPELYESWYQPYPGPRPTVSGRTKALVFRNAEGISNAIKDLMAVINSILPLSSSTTYRTTPNIPRPTQNPTRPISSIPTIGPPQGTTPTANNLTRKQRKQMKRLNPQ